MRLMGPIAPKAPVEFKKTKGLIELVRLMNPMGLIGPLGLMDPIGPMGPMGLTNHNWL